jgi:uncharacterized protein with von Willebrand factor type A (vWA) domain
VLHPGGANEHWNPEAGQVWLERARTQWPHNLWINPTPERFWDTSHSVRLIRDIFEGAMVPMTLEGINRGIVALSR